MLFQDSWWWFVPLMALAWWFPQNVLHEGSHALVYKALGYKITDFKPYPNRKRTHDDEGNPLPWYKGWSFARIWSEWPEDRPKEEKPPQWARGMAMIAPVLTNTLFLLALCVPCSLTGTWVHGILAGLMITNLVDGGNNFRFMVLSDDGEHTSDVWKFTYKVAWSPWVMRVVGLLWVIGFALALFLKVPWRPL